MELLGEWEEEIETVCEVDSDIECERAGESVMRVVTMQEWSDGVRFSWDCDCCGSNYGVFERAI